MSFTWYDTRYLTLTLTLMSAMVIRRRRGGGKSRVSQGAATRPVATITCRRRAWRGVDGRMPLIRRSSNANDDRPTPSSCCLIPRLRVVPARPIANITSQDYIGSRVVSVLDSAAEGPGFKSQSRRCRVTVLGKLFTPITEQQNW